jgi:hypothetical protein
MAAIQTGLKSTTKMPLTTNIFECFAGPERQVSKTRRIQYCLKLKPLLYLLPPLLRKPHNTLVMGRACFLRVPVSEANDLNYLLCRCDETGYASRLGNNETKPMQQLALNSATKNRTPNNPIKPNLMEQRRTRRWCRCLTWAR